MNKERLHALVIASCNGKDSIPLSTAGPFDAEGDFTAFSNSINEKLSKKGADSVNTTIQVDVMRYILFNDSSNPFVNQSYKHWENMTVADAERILVSNIHYALARGIPHDTD